MNVIIIAVTSCLIPYQLLCMDPNRVHSRNIPLFIKQVFDIEKNLEEMYDSKNQKESLAALEYFKEAQIFKNKTIIALNKIVSNRCLQQADPLTHVSNSYNTSLEEALESYKFTLEKLFLAQFHHYPQALNEIDTITLEFMKKLNYEAQKFSDFTPGYIAENIKKKIITDYDKKAGLAKSQQNYCVGLYHYFTAIYLKSIASLKSPTEALKKIPTACDNYETALTYFCLSGNLILTEPWEEIPSHIQMLHKIVTYLLAIKNGIEENQNILQFINNNYKFQYIQALLDVSWTTSKNRNLWELLSKKVHEHNQELFKQFVQNRNT